MTKVIKDSKQGAGINLSGIGKLKRPAFETSRPVRQLSIKALKDNSGSAYYTPKSSLNSLLNLKRGGREELQRDTLTTYASSSIRKAGRMFRYMVENELSNARSSIMITLTYGREVPDHKTAKKHLNIFLTRCRKMGELKYYVWVAQLQTGKRAKDKGLKSYRAENGSAIHFHILSLTHKGNVVQVYNAQNKFRTIWKEIVNKWEINSGFESQNIGGVDIRAVYDASKYITRYLKNEQDTIIGNMWNMSSSMREMIKEEKKQIQIDKEAFELTAYRFNADRLKRFNQVSSHNTKAFKMWNDTPYIVSDSISMLIQEIERNKRNLIRIKSKNEKLLKMSG